eukprot:10465835-Lingulodinium_polyedra.AAC.1
MHWLRNISSVDVVVGPNLAVALAVAGLGCGVCMWPGIVALELAVAEPMVSDATVLIPFA